MVWEGLARRISSRLRSPVFDPPPPPPRPRKREFMSEAIVAKKDHYTYTSGKLPTYHSPKPIISLTAHLRQNVGLGEG